MRVWRDPGAVALDSPSPVCEPVLRVPPGVEAVLDKLARQWSSLQCRAYCAQQAQFRCPLPPGMLPKSRILHWVHVLRLLLRL